MPNELVNLFRQLAYKKISTTEAKKIVKQYNKRYGDHMKKIFKKVAKVSAKERIIARLEDAYQRGESLGYHKGKNETEMKLEIEKTKAKTELLKAAAEVAVTFSKVMYNINMLVNDKLPFNQAQQVTREMR